MRVLVAANRPLADSLVKTLRGLGAEVACVTEAESAVEQMRRVDGPVLLDYDMQGLTGTRAVQRARSVMGEAPLGVVYGLASPAMAHRALSAGATGVLPESLCGEALSAALTLLTLRVRFSLFGEHSAIVPFDAATALTDRELQVLHGVCDGLQNKEIAHHFGVSEVTVKMHVRAIIRKFGARNRTHAAMIARDLRIV